MKCFECPLNFNCALWLWSAWDVNWELCNCTDERLVALDQPFYVDLKLLKEYKENTWKDRENAYNSYTMKKNTLSLHSAKAMNELTGGLKIIKNKL